ncbi:MAG: hypothetical protein LBD75_05125 [Candidatus Peribacteria bacterium]|nr:hypothetical protein [Candidatus Peribacteria bacterium]
MASNIGVWDIFGTHIEIGLGKGKNVSPSSTFTHRGEVQQGLKQQISYALLSVLDGATTSSARAIVLSTYLTTSRSLLQEAQHYLNRENERLAYYTAQIQECETPIAQYNADFSLAVQQGQVSLAEQLVQNVASLRACIAENGVYYRAHLLYRDTLMASQTALQKRVDYLVINEERIIKWYDMLKPQLLKELYEVSRVLEVNYSG